MIKDTCYVVLAHHMDSNAELGPESKKRIHELLKIIENLDNQLIFFCGWDYRDDCKTKIAVAQKAFFTELVKNKHEIKLVLESRDTVGDAFFLRKNYYDIVKNKKIIVITSDYHVARTKCIFDFIFGKQIKIEVKGANIENIDKKNIKLNELKSLAAFQSTFQGVDEGDFEEIYKTIRIKHPYYNGDKYQKIK